MQGAVAEDETRLPALLTFFTAASGFTVFGIGGAFWGLLLGWGVFLVFRMRAKTG